MDSLTYHFLFNLSLIIAMFYIYYISTKELRVADSNIPSILYYSSALILSYIFSYRLNDHFIIDMRIVPFLVGSLYHPISPILGIIMIVVRGFHGIDGGFVINAVVFTVFSYLLWEYQPVFLHLKSSVKMVFAVLSSTVYSTITLLLLYKWIPSGQKFDVWFAEITIPALGVLILTFLLELIRQNEEKEKLLVKEEKLKAIEQMGAAITHEIRNPLTAAIGFTELLSSETLDLKSRKQFIAILKSEIEQAEQIIQNYLNFTKPTDFSLSHVNVDRELEKVLRMLQPLANYRSIQIDANLSSAGVILVDSIKFTDSMTSFLQNLLLLIEEGGGLMIKTFHHDHKVMIKIEMQNAGLMKWQRNSDGIGDRIALISAYKTLRAMKAHFESKNTVMGHTILLTFKSKNGYCNI